MGLMNPYLNQYKKNEVETSTPEEIFLLLYDAAINFLNKAKLALSEDDEEAFRRNVQNCQNIILEFMNTLDMEIGGKFAETLYSLYRYYNKTLIKASISRNEDNVDEVLRHLTNLRKTWKQAIDIQKAEQKRNLANNTHPDSTYIDKISISSDENEDDDNDEDDDEDDEDSYDGVA